MSTYTTKSGDMWDLIAHNVLGSRQHTDTLMRANTQYREYFIFPSGIVLTLPKVTNKTVNEYLPSWKRAAG